MEKNTEGIEAQIDDIRIRLNKLTSNNYESLSKEIINYIKKDIETNNDILEYVGKSIFEVGSMNSFWSKIYARLFNDLILSFPIMKDICLTNFKNSWNYLMIYNLLILIIITMSFVKIIKEWKTQVDEYL